MQTELYKPRQIKLAANFRNIDSYKNISKMELEYEISKSRLKSRSKPKLILKSLIKVSSEDIRAVVIDITCCISQ